MWMISLQMFLYFSFLFVQTKMTSSLVMRLFEIVIQNSLIIVTVHSFDLITNLFLCYANWHCHTWVWNADLTFAINAKIWIKYAECNLISFILTKRTQFTALSMVCLSHPYASWFLSWQSFSLWCPQKRKLCLCMFRKLLESAGQLIVKCHTLICVQARMKEFCCWCSHALQVKMQLTDGK